MSYRFCSKFHTLSSSAKPLTIGLRFHKVTESLKVETFFETQCSMDMNVTTALF